MTSPTASLILNPKADYTSPAEDWVAITPSDTVNFTNGACRGVYVGVTGDVVAISAAGSIGTFKACPVGYHPIRAVRINTTNTTATNMIALY